MTTAAMAPPLDAGALDLMVEAKRPVADGVVELVLHAPRPLPAWSPGAHLDLVLADDLVRSYSLCGDPDDRHRYRIAVLREPGGRGGSAYVHDTVRAGDTVRAAPPANHFALVDAPRYQFIAGGIGITPLLAMVRAVEAKGSAWSLLYGGRRLASMAYRDELERLGDRVRIQPEDTGGRLDLAAVLEPVQSGTLVYACGPEALLSAVEARMSAWPQGSLHLERFAAAGTAHRDDDSAFEVVFARSGISATVPPGVSILDVATDCGVFVPRSCSEGICGTCETEVIEGEPDHRDSVLTPEDQEAGSFMPCVSRCSSGRLVIDL
jgi:ferredoxin-NADP reductase